MLDLAYKYEDKLRELMMNTWYDEKYMFYHYGEYRRPYELDKEGDWNGREFVSLDRNGEVIGYIGYEINRSTACASGFGAINFSDNKIIYGADLAQAIDDVFCKFNMNKMEWSVVVGNPIERSYDRWCKKLGGSIVGIKHQHVRCMDGNLYDHKDYELFRDEYLKHRRGEKHGE